MKIKYYISALAAISLFNLSAVAENEVQTAEATTEQTATITREDFKWLEIEAMKALSGEKITIQFNMTETEITPELIWNTQE